MLQRIVGCNILRRMPTVVAQNRFFQNAMRADFEDGDKPPRNSSGQQRQVRFPHSKKENCFPSSCRKWFLQ